MFNYKSSKEERFIKSTDLVHHFCLCFFLQLLPQCLCGALWWRKERKERRKGSRPVEEEKGKKRKIQAIIPFHTGP